MTSRGDEMIGGGGGEGAPHFGVAQQREEEEIHLINDTTEMSFPVMLEEI